ARAVAALSRPGGPCAHGCQLPSSRADISLRWPHPAPTAGRVSAAALSPPRAGAVANTAAGAGRQAKACFPLGPGEKGCPGAETPWFSRQRLAGGGHGSVVGC